MRYHTILMRATCSFVSCSFCLLSESGSLLEGLTSQRSMLMCVPGAWHAYDAGGDRQENLMNSCGRCPHVSAQTVLGAALPHSDGPLDRKMERWSSALLTPLASLRQVSMRFAVRTLSHDFMFAVVSCACLCVCVCVCACVCLCVCD